MGGRIEALKAPSIEAPKAPRVEAPKAPRVEAPKVPRGGGVRGGPPQKIFDYLSLKWRIFMHI